MSLPSLPIETITRIFDLLDESDMEKLFEIDKHREMCKALMALRLTCKQLEGIATPQLFRTFYLSSTNGSWLKALSLAANQKFRVHLQTLACYRPSLDASQRLTMQEANSPKLGYLDFSQFPNLKVLKADDTWMMTKKRGSNAQISSGRCGIRLTIFGNLIDGLREIERYGFSLASVNCSPYVEFWPSTFSLDLSGLRYLRLFFDWYYWVGLWSETDLDHLKHLPNLEEFHMDQFRSGRSDECERVNPTMNVLKLLNDARDWPRLRYLDLRHLITTVEDVKAFVAPHAAAGTLETFEMHGDLVCAQVTEEEKQKRVDLPHWINTVICPEGGRAKFKHVLGQPENECYYPKYPLSDTEGSDTDAEDTEESDTDAKNTEKDNSQSGLSGKENLNEESQAEKYSEDS